jgi:hypothetical protein
MRKAWLGLALLLAACAPHYPTRAPPSAAPAPVPAPPQSPQPPPTAQPPQIRPPPQTPRATGRDQCGASDLQGLVGRPRTEIPIPVDPNRQRVACTTCPVTLDDNPQRLNFFFDAQTGRIKEIRCG